MKIRLIKDLVIYEQVVAKKGDVITVLDDGPPGHPTALINEVRWRLFPFEFIDRVTREDIMAELQEMRDRLGIIIRKVESLED